MRTGVVKRELKAKDGRKPKVAYYVVIADGDNASGTATPTPAAASPDGNTPRRTCKICSWRFAPAVTSNRPL